MKLYIFRCRTRPRMFGVTRYETASNLPTHNCSGWEFYERVDLSERGRLRYAVDTATVRRLIQQRGWHVWDESRDMEPIPVRAERSTGLEDIAMMETSSESLQEEAPADEPLPDEPYQTPAEISSPPMTASPEYLPEEIVQNTVLREPKPVEERKTVPTENVPEYSTKKAAENAPLPREFERPIVKPETPESDVLLESWRKKTSESTPLHRERPRVASEPKRIASEELPDYSPKKAAESTPPPREYQRSTLKPETLESDGSLESWRKKTSESTPLRRDLRPPFEPKARPPEELPDYSRKKAAESTTLPHEHPRAPAETRIPASAAPAPTTPQKVVPRPPMDVPSSRPAPVVKPDKVEVTQSAPKAPARHQVTWFDIPVRDIDRAMRFYSAVLGMPIKKEQAGPGAAIAVLPHADGSIGGSLVQNLDAKPSESGPLLYLNTQGRLDEALREVEKNGGRVVAEKHSIAPFGFRAIVLDSEGNRIALHSR